MGNFLLREKKYNYRLGVGPAQVEDKSDRKVIIFMGMIGVKVGKKQSLLVL